MPAAGACQNPIARSAGSSRPDAGFCGPAPRFLRPLARSQPRPQAKAIFAVMYLVKALQMNALITSLRRPQLQRHLYTPRIRNGCVLVERLLRL